MSYWRKCLSTGDYQYIATGEPAPEDIVVQWWEVELARKDKRIAELEARLENAELEKATAEEAEALSRFRAERATVKIVPTTVRTEWYGQMW